MPVKWMLACLSCIGMQRWNIDHVHMWTVVSGSIACGMGVH